MYKNQAFFFFFAFVHEKLVIHWKRKFNVLKQKPFHFFIFLVGKKERELGIKKIKIKGTGSRHPIYVDH